MAHFVMTESEMELKRPRPQGKVGKSPFRYPGGKAYLLPEIATAVQSSCPGITYYAEPYAGGAGAAIELLALGAVSKIFLNDADPRIAAAWQSILQESEGFVRMIQDVDLDIGTWRTYNEIVKNPHLADSMLQLGFATFFMNRTNRSGIVTGAGPIGGYEQSGQWRLGARFYRETMEKRVRWLAERQDQIEVTNLDGVEFIRSFKAQKARRTFFFIDPPYVGAGSRLYLNRMNEEKHTELAKAIRRKKSVLNWLMTYDDCPLIRSLYSDFSVESSPIRYSLQKKRTENELKISPLAA